MVLIPFRRAIFDENGINGKMKIVFLHRSFSEKKTPKPRIIYILLNFNFFFIFKNCVGREDIGCLRDPLLMPLSPLQRSPNGSIAPIINKPRKSIVDAAEALHRIIFAEPSTAKFSWSVLHFKTNGQPTGQSGRKDRKRHGSDGSGMIHVNISMGVPKMPVFSI